MAKPLKIVLIVVGVFFALLIGGALAATFLFDPNDYSGQITEGVKKETGRELQLGNLELSVFPWLAVGAENVKLANAEGFGSEPFAEIGAARVGVKLLPLLFSQKVEISTLTLTGLRLRPAIDKNGKNNWDDLSKPKEGEEEEPKVEGEASFKLEDLDIGGIDIEDGAISYSDAQAGKSYSLEKLHLQTGKVHVGEPIDLEMGVSVASSAPAASADIELSGQVDWDLEAQRYGVRELLLKIKGKGDKLLKGEDATLDAELKGQLAAELGKQAAFKDLKLTFAGGNAQMEIKGDYSGDFSYDLANQVLSLPALNLAASASGKAMPQGQQDIKLTGGIHYDQKQGTAALSKLKLTAAGLDISTDLKGGGLNTDAPNLAGPFNIAPFSPRDFLTKFGTPVQTVDPNVLKEMSLSAQYKGGLKSATLSDVVLKLDQTTARGRIDVRDFATQAVQFALNVDTFDADRYLAPETKAKIEPEAKGGSGSINDIQLPAEMLGNLNAEGTLDIGLLKIKGLKINNAQVKLAGTKGHVHTQTVSAKLYGGTVSMNHQFKPGPKPQYQVKTSLAALNAAPFVQDFMGKDLVSGLGSLNLNLSGEGLTVGDLRKALDGDLGLKIENGAVKGFNLGQIIRKAKATLSAQAAPAETEPQKTDFTAITFTAQILDGILKSDSLNAASPLFRIGGSGEINLIDETINYLAKPTIVDTSKGEGGKGLEDLKGLMIPIKLTGSLFSPSYKLDLQSALKQKAMDKVNEKVDVKKDELKQKLNEKLNKWLTPKPKPAEQPPPAQPAAAPAPEQKPAQ